MRRLLPAAFAVVYAGLPLYPAFIALTSVAFPGISVVPRPIVWAVLALVGLLMAYSAAMLLRYRAGSQPLLLPMLAWLAAAALSALLGFDPLRGLLFLGISGSSILWHCMLLRFYAVANVATAIFWSYLASGALAAAAAIAMVVTRWPAGLYALQHGRATGTFVLPGELAAYLVVLLPIAYALARSAQSPQLRGLAWTTIFVGVAALVLTYSRAGWMGFAAAVAFFVATQTGGTRRGGAAAAVAAAILGAAAVLLLFNSHHDPSEDYTRISIWQAALQIIDRFPLTGVGPFDFPLVYPLVHVPDADASAFHAHSLYLTFFAEGGVLMLAAFVWLVWVFVAELRARLARSSAPALLSLAVAAGLVGVAVQGLIDTMSIVIFGLWLPAMGLALASASRDAALAGDRTAA